MPVRQAVRRPRRDNGSPHPHPLPDRLALIDKAIASIQRTLDVQFQRIAAMQAEIDHLRAKKHTS